MHFFPRGVAFEFFRPKLSSMGGGCAILATAVAMPKTTVDEDCGFIFRQHDVGADDARSARLRS